MTTTLALKKQERNISIDIKKEITSELIKKKIYLAELIKTAFNNYFNEEDELNVDSEYSIYKLPIVNEEINIIDFRINSLDVNVVATVDREKNRNVYLPKIYKNLNYKPDIIVFVNFKKTLTKMDILGFIENVNPSVSIIEKYELIPAENLTDTLKTKRSIYNAKEDKNIKISNELMLGYIDNELSEDGKNFFCKYLLTNREIRKNYKLFYAINCKFISLAKNQDINKLFSSTKTHNELKQQETDESISEQENNEICNNNEPNTQTIQSEDIILLDDNNDKINTPDNFEEEIKLEEENTNVSFETEIILEEEKTDNTQDDIVFIDTKNPVLNEDNSLNITNPPEVSLEEEKNIDISSNNEEVNFDNVELKMDEETPINQNEDFDMDNIELKMDEETPLSEYEDFDINDLKDSDFFDLDELKAMDISEETLSENSNIQNDTISNSQEISQTKNILSIDEPSPLEQAIHDSVDETQEDIFNMLSELSDNQTVEINSLNENDLNYIEETMQPINENTQNFEYTKFDTTNEPTLSPEELATLQGLEPNKENLDAMIEENANFVEPQQNVINTTLEHNSSRKSNKSKLIILSLFILATMGACGAYFMNGKTIPFLNKKDEIPIPAANNNKDVDVPPPPSTDNPETKDLTSSEKTDNTPTDKENLPPIGEAPSLPDTPEKPLPKIPQGVKPKQLHEVVGMAISKDYNRVRISHVWWGVPSGLDSVPVVSEYLKITGASIKSNLSKSLANATELAQNYGVIITITYKKDGSVVRTDISKSSGSKQIDDIILSTIQQTLDITKMPALKINKAEYSVELHIDL